MGIQIYPTVPVAQPAAEPWPVDEHTIRIDEMFARQLDTEFSAGVRAVLHHPETGVAALNGEAALEAIAGALPALHELKERTLSQAMGPRQRGILEPLIETRLNWAAGTLGRLAERATVEVDDASVADRIAGLRQDAAAAWYDPAHLQKLGRTTVEELRYQGERRGWDPTETDARVRDGLSDFSAGAVETAIGRDDLAGAAGLYEHARAIIDPERQAALDRRFVRAREVAVYRDIDRDMAGIPIEPAGPPGPEIFEDRAVELTPDDATDEMRARIAGVAEHAHRHAERQWSRRQAEAGVAAFDWVGTNSGRSFLAIPPEIRDWLAPDQWRGLEALLIEGRPRTDGDLFERLDWQMIYQPDAFAGADLDRYKLSLDDEDHARFAGAQKAIIEGRIEPALVRYDRMRRGIDRALKALGIDTEIPDAADARADARDRLDSFEAMEGRAPKGEDIDGIASRAVENLAAEGAGTDSRESVRGEDQSATSDIPSDEEHPPSPADNNVSVVPLFESARPAMPDSLSTEDRSTQSFADDPNVIRVGSGNSSRRGGGGRPATPIEEMRGASFQSTLNAIRELEPNNRELAYIAPRGWVPSARDVARVQEELLRAKARAAGETSAIPIGPYARESIPARSAERNFTAEERREVDRIGNQHGCHTCGTIVPGSTLGHWVPDHQIPSRLNRSGEPQHLYPQCLSCSARQGGQIAQQQRREKEDK